MFVHVVCDYNVIIVGSKRILREKDIPQSLAEVHTSSKRGSTTSEKDTEDHQHSIQERNLLACEVCSHLFSYITLLFLYHLIVYTFSPLPFHDILHSY